MECKACGTWFVSGQNDGVCLSCKTRLKKMGLDIPYDRLRVLVEADRDGRWSENGWRGQMTEKDLEIQELRQRQVKIFKAAEELKKTMDNLCDFCKSAAEASTKHCTPACGHCYIIKAYKNLEDLTEK